MLNLGQEISIAANIEQFGIDIVYDIKEAWEISRPNINPDETNIWDLVKLDIPITEFATVDLDIRAPIFIREIMTSVRNHVVWAQTSRVMNLLDWDIYSFGMTEGAKQRLMELQAEMLASKSSGAEQDEFRLCLPLSYMTRWSQKVSLRDLFRIEKYIRLVLNQDVADECISKALFDFAAELRDTLCQVWEEIKLAAPNDQTKHRSGTEWFWDVERSYKPLAVLGDYSPTNDDRVDEIGDIICIEMNLSWALRAQLVRHRHLIIQDNFRDAIKVNPQLSTTSLRNGLRATITGTRQVWLDLVRSRSCWIAQPGLWADLLWRAQGALGRQLSFSAMLPCASGLCPVNEDARQRLLGNDPGCPCPYHIILSNPPSCLKLPATLIGRMRKQVEQVGSKDGQQFWTDTINMLEKRTS